MVSILLTASSGPRCIREKLWQLFGDYMALRSCSACDDRTTTERLIVSIGHVCHGGAVHEGSMQSSSVVPAFSLFASNIYFKWIKLY